MLIGYARVSTEDQKTELQHDALKAAGCEKIFCEKASGAQRERPELNAAIAYMRDGDVLVVWKLDRLARSMKQLIETIENLSSRNIAFRSLTEAIETNTAGGKLLFHIFSALAEFERSIIRERTKAGLEAAHKRGRKGGRPQKLKDADMIAARAMLTEGSLTIAEIARQLRISPATFYRRLPAARAQNHENKEEIL